MATWRWHAWSMEFRSIRSISYPNFKYSFRKLSQPMHQKIFGAHSMFPRTHETAFKSFKKNEIWNPNLEKNLDDFSFTRCTAVGSQKILRIPLFCYRIVSKTRRPILQDDLEYKTRNLTKISSYTFIKTKQP